jgi:hypothetical protein
LFEPNATHARIEPTNPSILPWCPYHGHRNPGRLGSRFNSPRGQIATFSPNVGGDDSSTGGERRWRPAAASAGGGRHVTWLSVPLLEKGGSGGGRRRKAQADGAKEVVGTASVARVRRRPPMSSIGGWGRRRPWGR